MYARPGFTGYMTHELSAATLTHGIIIQCPCSAKEGGQCEESKSCKRRVTRVSGLEPFDLTGNALPYQATYCQEEWANQQ